MTNPIFHDSVLLSWIRAHGGNNTSLLSEGYQILFTGSKNIDPSPSYRISKFAIYIQLHCGRVL